MEVFNNKKMGWDAILNYSNTISDDFEYFKIAHHGSKTGHHEKLWSKYFNQDTIYTITPFEWGRHKIPTIEDINRICAISNNVYITEENTFKVKRDNNVEKMIKDVVGNSLKTKIFSNGHIRCRKEIDNPNAKWRIDLFNNSRKLCNN